jgi:hypothetical protein
MVNYDVHSYVIVGSVEFKEPKTYERLGKAIKIILEITGMMLEFLAASCHGHHMTKNAC